jgi:bacteriorhodopsin
MNESGDNLPKPNYKWPWFVLAAVVLAVVLAVVWMSCAVKYEREQRDFSAPLPSSTPAR